MNMTVAIGVMAAMLISGLIFASVLGSSATKAYAQSGKTVQVEIVKGATNLKDKAYSPNPVKVQPGTTVVWKNVDSAVHTVTSGKSTDKDVGKRFDSKVLAPNKEFKFTFTKTGTFDYFCTLHPAMVGKVTVDKNAPAAGDSGSSSSSKSTTTTTKSTGTVVEIVKGSTNLKDKAYKPDPVKIKTGTTVTWKNADTAIHTVTSGKSTDKDAGKLFDSKPLAPKKEFSFKFDKKGTFDYFCTLHPTMVGKVTVE
jgi:plastocyanin